MYSFSRRLLVKLTPCRSSYQAVIQLSDTKSNYHNYDKRNFHKGLVTAAGVTALGIFINEKRKRLVYAKSKDVTPGVLKQDLPYYSADEISKHTTPQTRIWVTYKAGVYDITDFVEGHPGGDQILMAAGNSVEPFWVLYGIHENPHVYEILETYRVGNINKEDIAELTKDMSDPYGNEPRRLPILKPASIKPFNAEVPASLLVENFYTPNELFYVRNHLPVPDIDPETYRLEVELEGEGNTHTFSLEELKKMPKQTITATVMCAGNRRSEMNKVKTVKGLNWGIAVIGNATWTGVPLRYVLERAGLDEESAKYKHVQFEAEDFDATGKTYGASIPIWKAVDKRGDVLLAYEMNGVPIPRDHGFPIRVIVPGVVGARNVKWLGKIIVAEQESDSHWQQNDYKGFSPSTDWDTVDFTKSPAIQELPVISAICKPADGDTLKVEDGKITLKGYAWSGGGQKIVRVDITIDGGKTWQIANLDHQDSAEPPQHWSWTLWSIQIPVQKDMKNVEIWAKAVDSHYNTQPETFENIWNLRGVLSNAYHRIRVNLEQ